MNATRAARKAENRATAARLFVQITSRALTVNCERALAILRNSGDDAQIAAELETPHGPGAAVMLNACRRAQLTGAPVQFEGCPDNSVAAFLTIADEATRRWRRQAAAIERAIFAGRLAVRDGCDLVAYRGERGRLLKRPNLWGLAQLLVRIEQNLSLPRAVRVRFIGHLCRQAEQNIARRCPGYVVPVREVQEVVPWIRAELRRLHDKNAPDLRLHAARTFQT